MATSRIFGSFGHRHSKAKGGLLSTAAALSGVSRRDIEHAGDSLMSHVRRARTYDRSTVEYPAFEPTAHERHMFAAGSENLLSSAIAGAARTARVASYGSAHPGVISASASVAGPLLTAYVLSVLIDVRRRGGRTLFFLARDGQILTSLCDRLTAWLGWDIEARYLFASRQAFYLASMPTDIDAALTAALAEAGSESVLGVGTSLGFEREALLEAAASLGLKVDVPVADLSPRERAVIHQAFMEAGHRTGLKERIVASKAATLAYFEQEGVFADDVAHIVDLGWRGNLQLRMQRAIGDRTRLHGYFMALFGSPPELEGKVTTWTSGHWPNTALIETFSLADHTSVRAFQQTADGRIDCSPPLQEARDAIGWGVRHQQAAITRFVDSLIETVDVGLYGIERLSAALDACSIAAFKHFCAAPTHDEANAYGSVGHACDQNHLATAELAPPIGDVEALWMLVDRKLRAGRTTWLYGSLTRSAERPVPRALIALSHAMTRLRSFR